MKFLFFDCPYSDTQLSPRQAETRHVSCQPWKNKKRQEKHLRSYNTTTSCVKLHHCTYTVLFWSFDHFKSFYTSRHIHPCTPHPYTECKECHTECPSVLTYLIFAHSSQTGAIWVFVVKEHPIEYEYYFLMHWKQNTLNNSKTMKPCYRWVFPIEIYFKSGSLNS